MTVSSRAGRRLQSQDLGPAYRAAFPDQRFIVVSNREPYEHGIDEASGAITVRRPAGGLISALDPLLQAVGGIWIAWGSGDADDQVVDERQRVRVPPENPIYTLRRLWLDEQDLNHYYFGYCNQLLWPLCHLRPALTRVRARYWQRYVSVNRRFAEAALEEAGEGGAALWFQDYHLALTPAFVRERRADLTLAHFWHIPFPPYEIFRIATHGPNWLAGLLANDVMGFHLPLFCENFLRCAERGLGAAVDWKRRAALYEGHTCFVRAFPISIDVESFESAANTDDARQRVDRIRARYAPAHGQLGLGVDRIDYSKGLEEKLTALDQLWEQAPEFRESFTYVQIAVPSRTGIQAYDWLNEKLERMVWSINDRHGTADWRPVHLVKESLTAERLAAYYRAADLCIVSSLQDGMNLVAKEFIASQAADAAGVLVLSKFAGASEELAGFVSVNPYDEEDFSNRVRDALLMPEQERRERLARMRSSLRSIYDWMAELFEVWG
ncbi:MAG: alpha,alpha-trehalose-phosphate synthase (UDP-forming), partial [Longimicrobiales bacterium]